MDWLLWTTSRKSYCSTWPFLSCTARLTLATGYLAPHVNYTSPLEVSFLSTNYTCVILICFFPPYSSLCRCITPPGAPINFPEVDLMLYSFAAALISFCYPKPIRLLEVEEELRFGSYPEFTPHTLPPCSSFSLSTGSITDRFSICRVGQ